MRNLERFLAEASGLVWAKKIETMANIIITIVCTGVTFLLVAWLIRQIRMVWGL